jgi:hypothetical protein
LDANPPLKSPAPQLVAANNPNKIDNISEPIITFQGKTGYRIHTADHYKIISAHQVIQAGIQPPVEYTIRPVGRAFFRV